jgi:hypothetical protein
VNDTTGKIDMNINMADKELRKQALLNLAWLYVYIML